MMNSSFKKFLFILALPAIFCLPSAQAANGVMTTVFCIANAPINALNIKKMIRKESGKKISLAGVLTGGFQAAYGAFMIQEYNLNYAPLNLEDNGKNLGQVNIAVGAFTMASSILNLALNRKPKKAETSFNTQMINNHLLVGLCYRRKI